jgi:hypothetical protein
LERQKEVIEHGDEVQQELFQKKEYIKLHIMDEYEGD